MVRLSLHSLSSRDLRYPIRFHDVAYNVRPVSAGRRLVLTYNLVHSTLGPDILAASSNKSMAKLDLLLSYWKENVEEEHPALAYLLKDKVDDDKLSYSGLKGQDLQVVKYLRHVAEKYGFSIYLASLKRSIKLDEEYEDDRFGYERDLDQSEAESMLERVVDLDGTDLAKGMHFEDEMLIQQEPFEGVEPNDEDSDSVLYFRTVQMFPPYLVSQD